MNSVARPSGAWTGTAGDLTGRSAVCRCGQDLDLCHTCHCPRCGATLHLLPGDLLPGDLLPGDLLPGDLLPGNLRGLAAV